MNAMRTRKNQALLQPDQLGHPHKATVHLKKSHQLLTAISLKQMRKEKGHRRKKHFSIQSFSWIKLKKHHSFYQQLITFWPFFK
jgi:hypothetical protein